MSGTRNKGKYGLEDGQRDQLRLYYKQELKPIYPDLGFVVVENRGYKSVVCEPSHPDGLWRLKWKGEYYWLFQELKTKDGKLDKGQKEWWSNFEETKYAKGVITKGLQEHYKAVDEWLQTFYSNHKFKVINPSKKNKKLG